mgnify:CR=1 FL=1
MSRITFARSFDRLLDPNEPPSTQAWTREFGTTNFAWSVRPFSGDDVPKVKASLKGLSGNKTLDVCVSDKGFGKVGAFALAADDALMSEVSRINVKNFADVRIDLGDGILDGPSIDEVTVRITNFVRGSIDATDMDGPLRLHLDLLNNKVTSPNLLTAELTGFDDWVEVGSGWLGSGKKAIPAYNGRDTEIRIDLGNGNDTYLSNVAFASKDTIVGGFGNDKINGGAGDDLIFGDQDERGFASTLDVKLEIRFESESADFRNVFGWYDRTTGEAHILLANTDLDSDPNVIRFLAELNLTPEQYRNLEFFLVPNGYAENGWLAEGDPTQLELRLVQEGGGWILKELDTGRPLYGFEGVNLLTTEPGKNPNGWYTGHLVDQTGGEREYRLALEDHPADSGDFDDAVFSVRARAEGGLPGNDVLNGGAGDDHLWGGEDNGRYALKYLIDGDFDLFGETYAAADAFATAELNEFGNIVVSIGGALQALALLTLGDGSQALMLIQLTGDIYAQAEVTITNDFLVETFGEVHSAFSVEVLPLDGLEGPLALFNEVELIGGDTLLGDSGRDTFWFNDGDGVDVIVDFERGVDVLKLERGEPIRQTVVTDAHFGRGLLIEHGGDGDAVFLMNVESTLTLVSSGSGYDSYA